MTGTEHSYLDESLSQCCLTSSIESMTELRLEASADFLFPYDFAAFQGHFPGNPILPAIVQLAMVRFLAAHSLGKPVMPSHHQKIKFKGVIRPEDAVTVNIKFDKNGVTWGGLFSLKRSDGALVATGIADFNV